MQARAQARVPVQVPARLTGKVLVLVRILGQEETGVIAREAGRTTVGGVRGETGAMSPASRDSMVRAEQPKKTQKKRNDRHQAQSVMLCTRTGMHTG